MILGCGHLYVCEIKLLHNLVAWWDGGIFGIRSNIRFSLFFILLKKRDISYNYMSVVGLSRYDGLTWHQLVFDSS